MKSYISILFIGTLTLIGCQGKNADLKTEPEAKKDISNISVGALKIQPLIEHVRATGTIDVPPMERKVIHSFIDANLTELNVIEGETVKKGQVLARMSHPNLILLQQNFLEEQLEVTYLEKELQRKESLSHTRAASAKEINELKKKLGQSKIKYQALSSQLQMIGISPNEIRSDNIKSTISILAPFKAQVSNLYAKHGSFISSNEAILELLEEDHKHLELDIFAIDANRVKIGQIIEVSIPGDPNVYFGKVYLINPDIKDNRLSIHGHLDDQSVNLKVGTYVQAKIIISDETVSLIENDELIREGEDFFLYQKEGDSFERVLVSTGKSNEIYTEILNSNNQSNWVIKGNYYLQDF